MNVYDFDETIYDGDSTVDFYKYCLRKKPYIIFRFPLITAVRFLLDQRKKLLFKERFYRFLRAFDDIDETVERFWDGHEKNIKRWYLQNRRDDDVVISASPEFLLEPVCRRLEISVLLASRVDKRTGLYSGENCWGDEKVRRFYERFENGRIENFYSDSYSDTPLARLAGRAYIVKGETLYAWEEN